MQCLFLSSVSLRFEIYTFSSPLLLICLVYFWYIISSWLLVASHKTFIHISTLTHPAVHSEPHDKMLLPLYMIINILSPYSSCFPFQSILLSILNLMIKRYFTFT